MTGYDAAGYAAIAAALNANFAAFPADITVYGLTADALQDLDLRRGPGSLSFPVRMRLP